jgi:Ca2+-binding RTX toxin-like protein
MRRLSTALGIAAAIVTAAATSLAFGAGSGPVAHSSALVDCAYVQAGAPGPPGNRLRITDPNIGAIVFLNGTEVGVQAFNGARTLLDCSGPTPTVNNIDRIDYRGMGKYSGLLLDENGAFVFHPHTSGLLAPGASPEPGGDEIEIFVNQNRVLVEGRRGGDNIELGNLSKGRVGINLDVGEDRSRPDADIIVPGPRHTSEIRVNGQNGNDRISGRGLKAFTGKLTIKVLRLIGAKGDDTLFGSPKRDRLGAGNGDDLLRAGRGRDDLTIQDGRDRAYGGPGEDLIDIVSDVGGHPPDDAADLIVAGSGPDRVFSARNGFTDSVRCGSGVDDAFVDSSDHRRNCEHVRIGGS